MGIKLVDVLFFILSLIIVLLTAWLPVFVQSFLGKYIDDTAFKKKRITRGKVFLRPLNNLPQEMYGIIYPMYYMQKGGHYLAVIDAIIVITVLIVRGLKEGSLIMILVLTILWVTQTIINIVIVLVTVRVSSERVAMRRADIAKRREESAQQRKEKLELIKRTRREIKAREIAKRTTREGK
ncbi:MAG: hypothetical protein PHW00_03960 [Clostridia bacterium]|nr:hypothetical protein [Clostridia bacterium]